MRILLVLTLLSTLTACGQHVVDRSYLLEQQPAQCPYDDVTNTYHCY